MKLREILNVMNGKQTFELREVFNGNFVGSTKLVEMTLNACNYCTLQQYTERRVLGINAVGSTFTIYIDTDVINL
jgi:hypothetical protein